jgi:hypothetical protein
MHSSRDSSLHVVSSQAKLPADLVIWALVFAENSLALEAGSKSVRAASCEWYLQTSDPTSTVGDAMKCGIS